MDLSAFYLDILKDRLYTSAARSLKRRSAQTVLVSAQAAFLPIPATGQAKFYPAAQ